MSTLSLVVRVLAHRIPKVLLMVTIPGFLTRKDLYHISIISWNCYHPEDFWNAVSQHSHYTEVMNRGIVTIRRMFGTRCAIALHGIAGESGGNYHLINEESTGGREFRLELPAHRRGIRPRKVILPGITNSFTRIQAGKIKNRGKSFEW
jgi:hypothetical protein